MSIPASWWSSLLSERRLGPETIPFALLKLQHGLTTTQLGDAEVLRPDRLLGGRQDVHGAVPALVHRMDEALPVTSGPLEVGAEVAKSALDKSDLSLRVHQLRPRPLTRLLLQSPPLLRLESGVLDLSELAPRLGQGVRHALLLLELDQRLPLLARHGVGTELWR